MREWGNVGMGEWGNVANLGSSENGLRMAIDVIPTIGGIRFQTDDRLYEDRSLRSLP